MKSAIAVLASLGLFVGGSAQARLEATCDTALNPGDQAQVHLTYYPEIGDPTPGGIAVGMAANVTEQLGLVTVYGPWFRQLSSGINVACGSEYCSGTFIVDAIPTDIASGSLVMVSAALLDQGNKEIANAGCNVRVL